MLGRVDQDRYDASSARSVPAQEELDYPQYFTSHGDADERGTGQWDAGELSDGLPKSDVVVDARGDNKPASPVFDRRALLKARAIPKRYKIEPSMGNSMPDILLPYLFDAAEIRIRDPYMPLGCRALLSRPARAMRMTIARSRKRRSNSYSSRGDSSGLSSIGASLITSTTVA